MKGGEEKKREKGKGEKRGVIAMDFTKKEEEKDPLFLSSLKEKEKEKKGDTLNPFPTFFFSGKDGKKEGGRKGASRPIYFFPSTSHQKKKEGKSDPPVMSGSGATG